MLKNFDINFDLIDDTQFEKLCFDLLMRLGFQKLKWRGGTDDQGRDIEAELNINYPLIGTLSKEFHFECKKYSKRVSKNKFLDKIAWADANKPDHLVFLVSSHITNQTKFWFDKISNDKPYKIHVLEGEYLKNILSKFPELIKQYFSTGYYGLLLDQMKSWLIYENEPATKTLSDFLTKLDLQELSDGELLYILSASLVAQNRVFDADEGVIHLNFENIMKELKKRIKGKKEMILTDQDKFILSTVSTGSFDVSKIEYDYAISEINFWDGSERYGYHCIIGANGFWWELGRRDEYLDKGLEFIIFADSNYRTEMRLIPKDSFKYYKSLKSNKFEI